MIRSEVCSRWLAKLLSSTPSVFPKNKVIEKIDSFGSLPDGWDFGAGGPAPRVVRERAIKLYRWGALFGLRANAFPGSEGEVYVAFYRGVDTVEVCVNLDLSCTITLERGIGVDFEELDYREGLSHEETTNYLSYFAMENRCNSSEPYIAISTMMNVNASRVIASRTTREVSQSSTPNVFTKPVQSTVCI